MPDTKTQGRKRDTRNMDTRQPNNPLHGISLEKVVIRLEEYYGWEGLSNRISINCFKSDPSVKSSLKFLRKTSWARDEVERLYIATFVTKSPPGSPIKSK